MAWRENHQSTGRRLRFGVFRLLMLPMRFHSTIRLPAMLLMMLGLGACSSMWAFQKNFRAASDYQSRLAAIPFPVSRAQLYAVFPPRSPVRPGTLSGVPMQSMETYDIAPDYALSLTVTYAGTSDYVEATMRALSTGRSLPKANAGSLGGAQPSGRDMIMSAILIHKPSVGR